MFNKNVIKEFCKKYNIPEDEMDKFIVSYTYPILKEMIGNMKEEIDSIIGEAMDELEDFVEEDQEPEEEGD